MKRSFGVLLACVTLFAVADVASACLYCPKANPCLSEGTVHIYICQAANGDIVVTVNAPGCTLTTDVEGRFGPGSSGPLSFGCTSGCTIMIKPTAGKTWGTISGCLDIEMTTPV
jgi:hypothetical protein